MNLTRRGLFGSAIALLVAAKIGRVQTVVSGSMPHAPALALVNDGYTDDAPALQAILDRTGVLDGRELPPRCFFLKSGIVARPTTKRIVNMRFVIIPGHSEDLS